MSLLSLGGCDHEYEGQPGCVCAGRPRVINMRDRGAVAEAFRLGVFVRIDRATHWGNPFVIPKDGDRATVIRKYREWIGGEPHMVGHAREVLRGKWLGCWCAPKPCHGDVLAELADAPQETGDERP